MTSAKEIKQELRQQWIETPSWPMATPAPASKCSGTGRGPRPVRKIADAALVHRLTGVAPSVALHIPWDRVDDYSKLSKHAAELGMRIGAINPNIFQEDEYRLGSVCHPDPKVRRKATDICWSAWTSPPPSARHCEPVVRRRHQLPGQDDIRARQDRLALALRETYDALPEGVGMLLEYKLFEPVSTAWTCPIGALRWHTAWLLAQGQRAGRHGPSCSGDQHRVHRGRPVAPRPSRRVPFQQPFLRRRRPTGRRCGSLPAVPYPHEIVARALTAPARAWRSCSTSATTSRTRSRPKSARS